MGIKARDNHKFYLSKTWKHKRKTVMRKYNYEDQDAKRYGRIVEATMVHHIYPLTDYPELRLQSWNLLPLSNISHNKMHDRNTNKIINNGIYWQQKRKKDFEKFYEREK